MNIPASIKNNCVLWHDYTRGSLLDRSGNSNNGTVVSSPVWKNTQKGKSIKCSAGWLSVASEATLNANLTNKSWTGVLVFDTTDATATNFYVSGGDGVATGFHVERISANQIIIELKNPTYNQKVIFIVPIIGINYVIFGYNNDTGTWHVSTNGNYTTSTTVSAYSGVVTTGGRTIGARHNGSLPNGNILGYIEFSNLLTSEEMSQLYTSLLGSAHMGTLGKRNFIGNNLVEDGSMEASGTSEWNATDCTLSKQSGGKKGQCLRCTRTAGTFGASQTCMTEGTKYTISGWARSDGNTTPKVYNQATQLWTGTTSTDWQYFNLNFTCIGAAGTLVLWDNTSAVENSYTEWDEVVIVPYGQPILDAGRKRPTYRNTFEDAPVTLGTSSIDLNDFIRSTGTWKISQDSNKQKWLENVTIGAAYIPIELIPPITIDFDVIKNSNGSATVVGYFMKRPLPYNDSFQNGYVFDVTSSESFELGEITNGAFGTKGVYAPSVVILGVKYTIRITITTAGVHTMYGLGGQFTTWTLLKTFTDTSFLTANYFVFQDIFDSGDKISNIKIWKGVIDPLT